MFDFIKKRYFTGSKKKQTPSWVSLEERNSSTTSSVRAKFGIGIPDALQTESGVSPDIGENAYIQEQRRRKKATLVDAGRRAGSSRVIYRGHNIPLHMLTKDFFISIVQLDTATIIMGVAFIYIIVFFFWSFIWWLIVAYYPGCLYGASSYVEALAFSTVTQMTIGYGNTGPQACWAATWLIIIQSVLGVVLEAGVLGVVFARISHPHQRSRSIFISNKAVISRRDGILKFMFRIADIRNTQVVEPKVRAYLYTWGAGRITAEGERVPVRVEPLEVDYIDGMLLLPLIIEHTVDERSPLCGHTHNSLLALNAEIVVTFEGTTEMGNPFMARRSYIPEEIYWGYQFKNIVVRPDHRSNSHGQYEINLDRFHAVERQKDMANLHPTQLSQQVVNRAKRTVPYPLLGENTLVLSDVLCVAPNEDGELVLYCRVGDTYPNQMLEITAKMLLYRWKSPPSSANNNDDDNDKSKTTAPRAAPEGESYEQFFLECGYESGTDRLHLRLPTLLCHVIDNDSPLANWREPGGVNLDMFSEIVVVINAYMNVNNNNILRQRTYIVNHHVKFGYGFTPIVKHPATTRDGKPRVRWQHFHDVQKVEGMDDYPVSRALANIGEGTGMLMSSAPESHAAMRTLYSESLSPTGLTIDRNEFTVLPMDLQRYQAAIASQESILHGGANRFTLPSSSTDPRVLQYHDQNGDMLDEGSSLPYAAALHPTLPGPDRFRMTDDPTVEQNDYTVNLVDLSRYTASVAQADSLVEPDQSSSAQQKNKSRRSILDKPRNDSAKKKIGSGGHENADNMVDAVEKPHLPLSSSVVGRDSRLSSVEERTLSEDASARAKTKMMEDEEILVGPLAGVKPLERSPSTVSPEMRDDEDEGASGPIHFASSKARPGTKSLKEISSWFNETNKKEEDEEEEGHKGAEGD